MTGSRTDRDVRDTDSNAGGERSRGAPISGWLAALVIARRELGGFFRAPIAYVVGVGFLILQGLSFSAVVAVLSDPARPAPYGAVLRGHFGGTFWYWTVLLFVASAIAMRAIAEERRQGTWETLLTAPVSDAAVIFGKWLGAVAFYILLWVPTLAYIGVLAAFSAGDASFDLGPVATSYLGAIAGGAAFLAVGIAAGAATANQIIAAVAAFAALMLVFAAGQIGEVAPAVVADAPTLRAVLAHVDVRGHMDRLAGGELALAPLAFYAGLAAVALHVAHALVAVGRRRRAVLGERAVAAALVAVIAVAGNALVARLAITWDVTSARANSLHPETLRVLAAVDPNPGRPGGTGEDEAAGEDATAPVHDGHVDVLVIRAGLDLFADVQAEIDRLLDRMVAAQPLLRRRELDPALEPDRIADIAREFAIAIDQLADGGAVVFQRGDRRRVVDLLDMAGFDRDDLGAGRMARFRAEEAFARALAELTGFAGAGGPAPRVCTSAGHGELALAGEPGPDAGDGGERASWAAVGARLVHDGAVVEPARVLAAGVPARCRALVIAGPARPFAADEALAVARYLERGGRVLLALRELMTPPFAPPAPVESGLEQVLAVYGIWTPPAAVLDPAAALALPDAAAVPELWYTVSGYGEHPITDGFAGRRVTIWAAPRPVLFRPPGGAGDDDDDGDGGANGVRGIRGGSLVSTSPVGWGETDLAELRAGRAEAGARDVLGPVSIAAWATGPRSARLVVIGGAGSIVVASGVAARGVGAPDAAGKDTAGGPDGEAEDDAGITANALLAAEAVAWLTGEDIDLGIGEVAPEHLRLAMSDRDRALVFALCVGVLPAAFLLIGGLLFWRRRR